MNTNDSTSIGFVSCCLICGAIGIDEFHTWVINMIEKYDELPTYFYYLDEVNNAQEFRELIGFGHDAGLTASESNACIGIAYYRNPEKEWSANIPKGFAIGALKRNPQVVKRFHETFPFIELNDDLKALLAQAK